MAGMVLELVCRELLPRQREVFLGLQDSRPSRVSDHARPVTRLTGISEVNTRA